MGAFGVHGSKKWDNFVSERSIFLKMRAKRAEISNFAQIFGI